jgi:nodulation protein F
MNDELAATIIGKIRAHAGPDAKEITLDTELGELGIHSLELTEIVFELEDEFGIEIETNAIDAWSSLSNVGDLVEAVRGLVGTRA